MAQRPKKSALDVKPGVPQPGSLNPHLLKHQRRQLTAEEYAAGIRSGSRVVLGQAITLVESQRAEHQMLAQDIIGRCLPHSGQSVRIGITGSPGAGKSTFIEVFGLHLLGLGHRLAVLAIDPSSQLSHGSILGDKTRMEKLSAREEAFIRPSPAGGSLGGVAQKTREAIVLCEAAGYDVIIIETVGVGQSETAVHSMADFFLLLLLPGGGDELQGMKRGIVEMADLIAVNKADGERLPLAQKSLREYRSALHLFPPKESGWAPGVEACSALTGTGIPEIWQQICHYREMSAQNGYFESRRREQARYWLFERIGQQLQAAFFGHPEVRERLKEVEEAVLNGRKSSFQAAEELLALFLQKDDFSR
ncbi:MAG: methylmalonyl Co-A mutase-associated GTPase MeaB [Lewinellaceae bacterium]|nr:methylmalonyl Co-A mutase-associated GTPase MeaB [Lewinellaceae bacterium]